MIKTFTRFLGKIGPVSLTYLVFINSTEESSVSANKGYYNKKRSIRKWVSVGNVPMTTISYEFSGFLKLDFNNNFDKNEVYTQEKIINLPVHQLGRLVGFLKRCLYIMENKGDDIWQSDNLGSPVLKNYKMEDWEPFIVSSVGYVKGRAFYGMPTVVKDYREVAYEGYRIFISKELYFDFTVDELRDLIYIIDKTDFINLAQNMVNTVFVFTNENLIKSFGVQSEKQAETYAERDYRVHMEQKAAIDNAPVNINSGKNIFNGLNTKKGNE